MSAHEPAENTTRSDAVAWVEAHGDALYRYAVLRVRDADAAEDLVQETFLAALRGQAGFEGRSSERTWLIGILRRKIVDLVRERTKRQEQVDGVTAAGDAGGSFDAEGHWRQMPAKWPADPLRALQSREFWGVFERCLSRLPANLAETFCLRELDDLDSAELCKVLEISSSNMWTRLHRARMLLRQCLEQNWFADRK